MNQKKYHKREKSIKEPPILAIYLKEINNYPLLSRDEEKYYANLAVKGDEKSREKLINSNLRFVVNVAKHYLNRGLPFEDLISEGNIGLLNAIEKFDVNKGYHFISYAVWWIRQRILKSISEKSRMIKLPLDKVYTVSRIEKMKEEFQKKTGLEATVSEIAKQLGMEESFVEELTLISKDYVSFGFLVYEDDEKSPLENFILDSHSPTSDEYIAQSCLKEDINSVLRNLSPKEAKVIELRFGLNGKGKRSLREIGNEFKLTKERIRQIEKKALERLRAHKRILEDYIHS